MVLYMFVVLSNLSVFTLLVNFMELQYIGSSISPGCSNIG